MGPVRKRQNRTSSSYDPGLYENWTLQRLKEELRQKGISFPQNARRMALVRILRNANNSHDRTTILGANDDTSSGDTSAHVQQGARSHDAANIATPPDYNVIQSARSQNAPVVNNNGGDQGNRVLIDIVSKLSSTVQSLQQNVVTLTGQVNAKISERQTQTGQRNADSFAGNRNHRNHNRIPRLLVGICL